MSIEGHVVQPNPTRVASLFLASNDGQEHVEGNLDGVDEDKTMLVGDELEVDSVHNGPDLPRSLAGRQEVALDLVADDSE